MIFTASTPRQRAGVHLEAAPAPGPVAGWMFLIAGGMLLAATVLIPAADSLGEIRWQRDRALALEAHQLERIGNYQAYLVALESNDPQLTLALASAHLGLAPSDRAALVPPGELADPMLFERLEPEPPAQPARRRVDSTLMRWTTDSRTHLWLLAGSALAMLVGLLPAVKR